MTANQIVNATIISEAKPKNRALYAVLSICLGWIGIHNFYAGRLLPGLAQLGISFGLAFLVFPVGVVWLWAIIEIFAVKTDGHGVPMTFLPRR